MVMVVGLRFWGHRIADSCPPGWPTFGTGFTRAAPEPSRSPRCRSIGLATVCIWLLEGARLYFVIHALDLPDVGLGISASVFVALAAALLTAMPLTPAGIGFVEAGVAGRCSLYGVSEDPAAAVALTDRGIGMLTVIVLGGSLYLVATRCAARTAQRPSYRGCCVRHTAA